MNSWTVALLTALATTPVAGLVLPPVGEVDIRVRRGRPWNPLGDRDQVVLVRVRSRLIGTQTMPSPGRMCGRHGWYRGGYERAPRQAGREEIGGGGFLFSGEFA